MAFDNLLLGRDRDGRVALVTINRPKVLNALNTPTLDELRRGERSRGAIDGGRHLTCAR